MSLYAAIDLHSTNSVLAVMDQAGKPLLQCRRANDLSVLLADLAPFQHELVGVAVESTYNWYWLVDGLMDGVTASIWSTPRRSRNTRASSTVTTTPMRCTWRS